jgi:hypothetical protein
MIQHYSLRLGSFTKIVAKEPRCSMYVPIIAGDPSAKSRPQDDSLKREAFPSHLSPV